MSNIKNLLFLLFFCQALVGCLPSTSEKKNSSDHETDKLYSINVEWNPVTEDINGELISSISGYKIKYGTSSNLHTDFVTVDGQSTAHVAINHIPAGHYYISMTAQLSSGLESEASEEYVIIVGN